MCCIFNLELEIGDFCACWTNQITSTLTIFPRLLILIFFSLQVADAHVDTRLGGCLPIYPRHRPTLHHVTNHDPVPKENAGHGPKSMSTECHTRYDKKSMHSKDGKL